MSDFGEVWLDSESRQPPRGELQTHLSRNAFELLRCWRFDRVL